MFGTTTARCDPCRNGRTRLSVASSWLGDKPYTILGVAEMFKKLILAAVLTAGGSMLATDSATAGHPRCGGYRGGYGGGYGGGYSVPYTSQYRSYSAPYFGSSQFGNGYSGYNSYRPSIGIGFGGSPYGYSSGFGGYGNGFGGYRGGSGFSLYLGR